jgi:thymidylate synthase (FAD)
LAKHQVGFAWNEVSRRYVKNEPKFWWTNQFRNSADNIKQGSSSEINKFADDFASSLEFINNYTKTLYENAVTNGICPEQARAILPQSMMTEWIWTGSLYGWSRMYALRADPHTQKETQEYAHRVGEICSKYFPISWRALTS